jgi:hypothetical protein
MSVTRKSLKHTASENYLNVTKSTTPTIRVSHLLAAASVSALALALPGPMGIYGTRAWAQALPPGCEDDTGDTTANDGEVIECEQPDPGTPLDPIGTDVDDLTLILGFETNSVEIVRGTVSFPAGVQMSGYGSQNLTIRNSASSISGDLAGLGVYGFGDGATETNDLTIYSEASITGGQYGINVTQTASGSVAITTTNRVEGETENGIQVYSLAASEDVNIDATGLVKGARDSIFVYHQGTGDVSVTADELDATSGAGVRVTGFQTMQDVTIVLNDEVDAATGAYVKHYGKGALQIDAEDITADNIGIYAQTYESTTTATLNLNGTLSGQTGIYLKHRGTEDTTVTLGTNFNTSRTHTGIELRTTYEQADIYLNGTRNDTDQLTGEVRTEARAIDLHTVGADISVQDISLLQSTDEEALYAETSGGNVSINNIGNAFSQDGTAIRVDSAEKADRDSVIGAGGDVSIQNVTITDIERFGTFSRSAKGINVQSGPGNIYLGADGQGGGTPLGDVKTTDEAIYAKSTCRNTWMWKARSSCRPQHSWIEIAWRSVSIRRCISRSNCSAMSATIRVAARI